MSNSLDSLLTTGSKVFPEDEEETRGGEDFARKSRGIISVEGEEVYPRIWIHRRGRDVEDRKRYRPRGELKPRVEYASRNKYENNGDW